MVFPLFRALKRFWTNGVVAALQKILYRLLGVISISIDDICVFEGILVLLGHRRELWPITSLNFHHLRLGSMDMYRHWPANTHGLDIAKLSDLLAFYVYFYTWLLSQPSDMFPHFPPGCCAGTGSVSGSGTSKLTSRDSGKFERYQATQNVDWTGRVTFAICSILTLIARFMRPTLGPSGADRAKVGPMLAPWTLLSGECCTGTTKFDIFTLLWSKRKIYILPWHKNNELLCLKLPENITLNHFNFYPRYISIFM